MPAVGMMPVSSDAHFGGVDDLFGYAAGIQRGIGDLDSVGQRVVLASHEHVVTPLITRGAAVAGGVAESHQDLAGSVVPHDPEVGSGDGEAFQCLVRAVRSGPP